ncbi:MAG TPA: HEAT repeat domain-containing protein, partial [Blastocatellia bacterium]
MIKYLLTFMILLQAGLCAPFVFGQQQSARPGDNNTAPASKALARVQEMTALVESKDANALSMIKESLSDENWYVRGEAARALGRLGDSSAAQALVPLVEDQNWFVRDAALEALSAIKASPGPASIQRLLSSPDSYSRARAAATIGAINYAPAIDALIAALSDADENVKRAAANALAKLKAAKAADALMPLLKDEDASVRKAAAVALGRIGDKRAAQAILALRKDEGAGEWEYAAALYRLGHRDYLEPVVAALQSDYADVRFRAFETLLEFGDDRALPGLLAFATPSTEAKLSSSKLTLPEMLSARFVLAKELARFNSNDARQALIKLLGDPEPPVRAASVASLVKASKADPKDESPLIAIIGLFKKEKSPLVISAITEGLSSFDRSRVADLLLQSGASDGKLSPAIVQALASVDVTTDALVNQLSTGDIAARSRAAERLSLLGDSKAVMPLIATLSTAKEIELRVKAAQALGTLKDRRA